MGVFVGAHIDLILNFYCNLKIIHIKGMMILNINKIRFALYKSAKISGDVTTQSFTEFRPNNLLSQVPFIHSSPLKALIQLDADNGEFFFVDHAVYLEYLDATVFFLPYKKDVAPFRA